MERYFVIIYAVITNAFEAFTVPVGFLCHEQGEGLAEFVAHREEAQAPRNETLPPPAPFDSADVSYNQLTTPWF